jgi:hypothetical protein
MQYTVPYITFVSAAVAALEMDLAWPDTTASEIIPAYSSRLTI